MAIPRSAVTCDKSAARDLRDLAVLEEVARELDAACEAFPRPFASAHEGFAILKEEVDELWNDVMTSQRGCQKVRKESMRKEAIQVAAMAVRFILEVCDADRPA